MANADLAFGVLATELWSPAGLGSRRPPPPRPARLVEFAGSMLVSCRDWTRYVRLGARARHYSRRGCSTRASAPISGSGFMTQVIARRAPARRDACAGGGGVRLVDALAGIVRDAGGDCDGR